jgi:hypothetical protein
MTHYLYRFLAASWKFCMVIVVVFVGIPGADFSSDFLLLAMLFAAAIVLQDMPRAVRRGGVALCAAAFAAVYYVAWRELSVQSESSPRTIAGVVLVLVCCTLIERATIAQGRAAPFAMGSGNIPDHPNLGNDRGSDRDCERQPVRSNSVGENLREPVVDSGSMPDVVVYVIVWLVVSRFGVWFPSSF